MLTVFQPFLMMNIKKERKRERKPAYKIQRQPIYECLQPQMAFCFFISFFTPYLMPVHVFVRHVLGFQADFLLAGLTVVGEVCLVAWQAARMVIGEDIPAPC